MGLRRPPPRRLLESLIATGSAPTGGPTNGKRVQPDRESTITSHVRPTARGKIARGRYSPHSPPAVWTKISPVFTDPSNVIVQVIVSHVPNPKDSKSGPCFSSALYLTSKEKSSAPGFGVLASTPVAVKETSSANCWRSDPTVRKVVETISPLIVTVRGPPVGPDISKGAIAVLIMNVWNDVEPSRPAISDWTKLRPGSRFGFGPPGFATTT